MYRYLIPFVLALMWPVGASAQTEDNGYLIDSIYDLRNVRHLEVDASGGRLLVTLPDTILYFDLFPIRLIRELRLDIKEASAGTLSARGNLFVVGERDSVDKSRGRVGSLQVYKDFARATGSEADEEIELDTTPISDAFFNGAGEFFAVGPTRFSVLNISEKAFLDFIEQGNILLNDLLLQCGTSAQFSVFPYAGRLFYISSVNGSKVIEYGPVDLNGTYAGAAGCFNPNRLLARKSSLSASIEDFSPVSHALVGSRSFIDDDDYIDTGLLTFDVDERSLTFFPLEFFDEEMSIIRSESIPHRLDDQLGPPDDVADYGLLASDRDANVILLSYYGSRVVHRLSWQEKGFVYQGQFETEQPIKQLYITPLGGFAAIVSGSIERDGDEELTIIKWPDRIPPFSELRAQRFSVPALQKELGAAGVPDLVADGIVGSQTREAVGSFLLMAPTMGGVLKQSGNANLGAVISNPSPADPQSELQQTLRGLFPLRSRN